ncbi:uncharacterized protein F4822DRAFT_164205 [Hypoxylon trugodes]|uniref:uncharacterized protein n=1 Tax=Hypoxylon trugodes TaxID=326681 RepID=UPI00218DAF42|nr:uncharacterized protein F4822DRAFT_164205 [Hypoxylon trugodes]KAI1390827.1 hypothetical protein F4822DRAFT_164205 [Hypoxylon trugodes]
MNINQEGFGRRLDVIQKTLKQYNLKSTKVTPIAYVEHCPFYFNNYIYKIDLESPAVPATFPKNQSCTTSPPENGVSTIVLRMSNPLAEGLNNANRVENDVASQYLARQSIESAGLPLVVPAVYAWAPCRYPEVPGEAGFGWTISEFKPGSDLDAEFALLELSDAIDAVHQLAKIFTAIQKAKIPETVTRYGALTLDENGVIIGGQPPLLKGGPFGTYAELWVAKLQTQLADAENSSLLKGWEEGGARGRIDKYIAAGGVEKALQAVDNRRVLVHGDLTLNNVLYDKATKRITSVLDFDWSAVTHPCDEFLTGLWDIGGGIHERNEIFQPMLLSGDFSARPEGLSDEEVRKWEVAKAWDAAITQAGAIRPSDVTGVDGIQMLIDLEDLLCPFELSNEAMLKRFSDDVKLKKRQETEAKILKWLDTHGITP